MKIVVMGAGAVGGFFAGLWASAGLNVTLLGRTRQVAEYRDGISLTDYDGWSAKAAPQFTDDPAILAQADLIALTVKCTATLSAAEDIAKYARPGTIVLSLQNGVSNSTNLAAALPELIVLAGMVRFNIVSKGPAQWHKASNGQLFAQQHPILEPIVAASADGPAPLKLMRDMEPILWGKLLLNLNNPLNALSGVTLREELWQRPYRRVLAAAQREALQMLKEAGIRPAKVGAVAPHLMPYFMLLPNILFHPIADRVQKISPTARTSMVEDFAKSRPSEIDYLNGEVVNLAHRYGREAPINARIVELVREAESGGRRTWSGPDLAHAVLNEQH